MGAVLALFGAGGSIVTMPLLVYVLDLDPHRAAATSLVIVGTVALAGALLQWRSVQFRTAAAFGAAGMVGAVPGAWLNHQVPGPAVLLGFGAVMLAAAGRLLRPAPDAPSPASTETAPLRIALLGAAVGAATGFFGVGGGFLVVPALTIALHVPVRRAVATSLVVIGLNSAAGLLGHAAYGGVEWRLGAELTLAALAGAALSLPFARRLSARVVQVGFAGALGVVGVAILVQTVRGLLA
jgi:hypothetical protein